MNAIGDFFKSGVLYELAKNLKVPTDDIDDLVQEVALALLEYDQEKIKDLADKGQLKFFATRIMMNQYFSATSPYHYKYRRWKELIDGNTTADVLDGNDDEDNKE